MPQARDCGAEVLPLDEAVRGLEPGEGRALKHLCEENAKPKKLVAKLSPEKLMLQHIAGRIVLSVPWLAGRGKKATRTPVPVLRAPPVALGRLSRDGDRQVVLALKQPFRDGSTHV